MEFVRDTLRADLAALQCTVCGYHGASAVVKTDGPHFAAIYCVHCSRHLDWLAWPKEPEQRKRERRYSRRQLPELGDRCELCLRSQEELPAGETLVVHHVLDKAALVDGDVAHPDDPELLRVYCPACHSLANWARTYFGHYHLAEPAGAPA
jgi:hypothetical protein